MVSHQVEQEYAKLVQGLLGGEGQRTEGALTDRRDDPRFQVVTDDLWINEVPEFSLLDLSVSGLAISATYPLPPGAHIDVGLGNQVTAHAEVLGCRLVETATLYTPAEFRINCRFADATNGMELLVQAKRSEQQATPAGSGRG